MANKLCELLASNGGEQVDIELNTLPALPREGLLGLRAVDLIDLSRPDTERLLDLLDSEPHHLCARSLWPVGELFEDEPWTSLALSTFSYLLSVGLSPAELKEWLEAFAIEAERQLPAPARWLNPPLETGQLVGVLPGIWGRVPIDWLVAPDGAAELPGDAQVLADLATATERSLADHAATIPDLISMLAAIAAVRTKLDALGVWSCPVSPESFNNPLSYADYIRRTIAEGISEEPDSLRVEVLLLRSGLASGTKMTLAEIGDSYGLTRARIGQVENKGLSRLKPERVMSALNPLRLAAKRVIKEQGGSCERDSAAREIAVAFGWFDEASAAGIARLLTCIPEVRVLEGGDVALVDLQCDRCTALEQGVRGAMTNEHAALLVHVSEHVQTTCSELRASCSWLSGMSASRLAGLLASSNVGGLKYRVRDEWVLSPDHDGSRTDTKAARVLRVLRTSGRVMHSREVYDHLCLEAGDSAWSERNVYATLERSPDAVSWDTGSFIHVEDMPFPYGLIREIEDWLAERLDGPDALPMMSAAAAANVFHDRLLEAGVDAELALYSLLRISADARLVYPRYAKVYAAANFEGRVPLTIVIEEYVRDAGQPVEIAELRSYVCDAMGFKEFQFQIALGDTPGLLHYDRRKLIHFDLISVDPAAKARIIDRARALLGTEESVAAGRLFEATQVDCVLNHISTPQLLHSLIDRWEEPGVAAGRYPTIYTGEGHAADDVTEMVLEYVREKCAPCAMRELEETFVDARGYRAGTVWAVAQREEVHRYLRGTVVHSQALAWDQDKQAALERAATALLEARRAAGVYYAKITDLVESEGLPSLASGVVWTEQLLSDLLGRSGHFYVLGNARNAFVSTDNAEHVTSFGDLVAHIVQREFGGGAGLDSLGRRLQRDQLVLKNLTVGMLQDAERLEVKGLEVVVTGLVRSA